MPYNGYKLLGIVQAHKDLGMNVGMISKRVSLQGVPGFDNINYDAWSAECEHEFETA